MVLAAFAMLPPVAAHAASIAVTTQSDSLILDGVCSLREAVAAANSDVTVGGCTAGSGADVIDVPKGTFELTRAGASEDLDNTGDLDIRSDLVLAGAGAGATTIDAAGLDRVLDVPIAGPTVTIQNLTVTGGRAPRGTPGTAAGPGAAGAAGGGAGGGSLGG